MTSYLHFFTARDAWAWLAQQFGDDESILPWSSRDCICFAVGSMVSGDIISWELGKQMKAALLARFITRKLPLLDRARRKDAKQRRRQQHMSGYFWPSGKQLIRMWACNIMAREA